MPLPKTPLVVIEPSNSWVALNRRDLWAYRELLYFLTWRDIKNALLCEPTLEAVAQTLGRLVEDNALRGRLREAGLKERGLKELGGYD